MSSYLSISLHRTTQLTLDRFSFYCVYCGVEGVGCTKTCQENSILLKIQTKITGTLLGDLCTFMTALITNFTIVVVISNQYQST